MRGRRRQSHGRRLLLQRNRIIEFNSSLSIMPPSLVGGGSMARKSGPVVQRKDATVELARIDQLWRTVRTLIRSVAAVAGIYLAAKALAPLAGKETIVSLALSVAADFKFAVSIVLGGIAAAWAVVERSLRHRKTEYLQARIRELETQIDSNRSSSGLTPKGKTNPADRRS